MTPGILPCPSASAGRFALPIAMALIVLGALAARCPAQSADTKPAATEATTTQAATTEPTTTQAVASEPTTTQAATTEPTTTQATTRPTPQPDDPAAPIVLNFKDASLQTVLDYLAEAAGLVIIGNPKVDGRISLMSRRPVSVEAAIELLDSVLHEKGYAAVHYPRTHTLKVVTLDAIKNEHTLVCSTDDPSKVELGDGIITLVIPIHTADAVKLKADLASLIPSSADVASNASSNTLIVTGSRSVVRKVLEIVAAIDVVKEAVTQAVRVYPLKNANATNTAKLISDIFKDDATAQQQQPGGGGGRRFMFPGMQPPQQEEKGGPEKVKVTTSADDRTNTLVVSAPPQVPGPRDRAHDQEARRGPRRPPGRLHLPPQERRRQQPPGRAQQRLRGDRLGLDLQSQHVLRQPPRHRQHQRPLGQQRHERTKLDG